MDLRTTLDQAFGGAFGGSPLVYSRAPGRLEILGNHTDYNEGTVLSVAVDRETWVAAAPSGSTRCRVVDAVHRDERRFDAAAVGAPRRGDWANYIKGLVVELGKRGIPVPGFHAVIGSRIAMVVSGPRPGASPGTTNIDWPLCAAAGSVWQMTM